MKKSAALILAMAMLLALLAGCSSPAGQTTNSPAPGEVSSDPGVSNEPTEEWPQMTLTLSTYAAEDDFSSITSRWFIDIVTERTGGAIKFNEYFNGTLANAKQAPDMLSTGAFDCGDMVTIFSGTAFPLGGVMGAVPGGTNDIHLVYEIWDELCEKHPELLQEWENNNVHPLVFKVAEPYLAISSKNISSLKDFNGLKNGAGNTYLGKWFAALGAVNVQTVGAENYQNYKTNIIDSGTHNPGTIVSYQLYEVVNSAINPELGCGAGSSAFVFNLDTWNSLPANVQELFTQVGKEIQEMYADWMVEYYARNLEIISTKGGFEIQTLDEQERADWIKQLVTAEDSTINVYLNYANAAGYDGAAILSDYLTIAEELGHEWAFDISPFVK